MLEFTKTEEDKMRKYLARVAVAVLLLAVVLALLPGCGGESTPAAEPTAAPTEPSGGEEATAAPTTEPVEQEPLVIVIGTDAETLNPLQFRARTTGIVSWHVNERLVARGSDMTIQPWLAESWEQPDDLTWVFHLREGVTFSDGEEFTAHDVKFTFEQMVDPKWNSPKSTVPDDLSLDMDNIEIPDDYTIIFHTTEPAPLMLEQLDFIGIISEKYFSEASDAEVSQEAVGTGPYLLTEWVKDDHITLERRDDYWGALPAVKTIIFRPIPDAQTRLAELLAGNADIVLNISPDDTERVEATEGVHMGTISGGREIFLGIRCDQEPFNDVRVRQALNYAVNVEAILDNLIGVGTRMATGSNYPVPSPVEAYTYDPQKAAELLDDAGVVDSDGDGVREWNGQPLRIEVGSPNGRYVKDSEIAQAAAADLTAIGIPAEAKAYEWSVYSDMSLNDTLPPLHLLGFGTTFSGQYEHWFMTENFPMNTTHWNNPDFESIYAELKSTLDTDSRTEMIHELDQISHDGAPWVFIWKQVDFYGVSDRVDFTPRADEMIDLTALGWAQ
jgi:peptide/nickel transport system substrate-binding protein